PGLQVAFDQYQAMLMQMDLEKLGVSMIPVSFSGKPAQEMASEILEIFSSRRIGLYHHAALLDDLRRLRIRDSAAGWRLDPPRTSTGHGDVGISLAMSLWVARQDSSFTGVWGLPPPPQGQERSPVQALFQDHADCFGPASLAPRDAIFQGYW